MFCFTIFHGSKLKPFFIFDFLLFTVTVHERYMHRCLQLAKLGQGSVAPNPMVGSVLIHNGRIIGEGWHQVYGQAHAEVNCLNSVAEKDKKWIGESTMYVSLEPCAHYGKTPPCADLIIAHKIPKVVIGCIDPFAEVAGRGVKKLEAAGIEVLLNVLEEDCKKINRRFFLFHQKKRPYVLLKWAQTGDGFMGKKGERVLISNEETNRLVHKWRAEESAIFIGTTTALEDDPSLTVRLWPGSHPLRCVIDKELRLPSSLQLLNDDHPTIIFNFIKNEEAGKKRYVQVNREGSFLQQVLDSLFTFKVQSIMVEGGSVLLQSFINAGLWDEARVIVNQHLRIGEGVKSPVLRDEILMENYFIHSDSVNIFYKKSEKQATK